MKTVLRTLLCILTASVTLLVLACASTSDSGPTDAKADSKASTVKPGHEPLVAGPDYALINFIRPTVFAFAVTFAVWDSDTPIGILTTMHNLQYKAKPGDHIFMVRAENWGILKATVEAGKTYTIYTEPRMGIMKSQVHLEVIKPNDSRLDKWLASLEVRKPSDSEINTMIKTGVPVAQKALANVNNGSAPFGTMNADDGR